MNLDQTTATTEGTLLWEPSEERKQRANLTRYLRWLKEQRGLQFASYDELWRWSVTDLEGFWSSIWEFFGVRVTRSYDRVLAERTMPGARWFPGAELNFVGQVFHRRDDHLAVLFAAEDRPLQQLSYAELYRQTAAVAATLRDLGVQRGDRVVGYLPNVPQALVALLATASLGAVWSCCPPEFGTGSVVDRFQQIGPKVLFAADGYRYNGKPFDRRDAVAELVDALPSLETVVSVPNLEPRPGLSLPRPVVTWDEIVSRQADLQIEAVPFEHPLWILYTSGTTGLPKPIVQGHGGTVLEQLKSLSLHLDLGPDDRYFWFTTTGWMMWNKLISALLLGTTVVLYDGSPAYPDLGGLWRLCQDAQITFFGVGAPYTMSCRKAGLTPGRDLDLSHLLTIGSTGAPLPPEGYQWVYESVKGDVLLGSGSGGTDVCTAFVLSNPLLPVHAGEIQCRGLGCKVEAFDPEGRSLVGDVGELVLTEPLPSMPLYFWDDPDGRRYRESYFDLFPGVWRHGDWIKITERGSCIIYGRSDSTLNRSGIRMGTSDFYRVVEELPEVVDSLVVDVSRPDQTGGLLLFVVLRPGQSLDDDLERRIRQAIARELSPRHVPDAIHQIDQVPRTLNGKKVEVPVKRILLGAPVEKAISQDAMANPSSLETFLKLATELREKA